MRSKITAKTPTTTLSSPSPLATPAALASRVPEEIQPGIATQRATAARLGHSFGAIGVSAARSPATQCKLTVGAGGDASYEGEADLQRAASASSSSCAPVMNNTGLPDNLKTGVEHLSGMALDDVNVHYNSTKPADVQALAYTQGTDIHVAPGQEQHLAHEAWHVVQQKQGRVQPTLQMKGIGINDDQGLEREADVMGAKAVQFTKVPSATNRWISSQNHIYTPQSIQRTSVISRRIIQRTKAAYRVEYPPYKVQLSGNKVVGFEGNPDGMGINISFILPDHSEHFSRERKGD